MKNKQVFEKLRVVFNDVDPMGLYFDENVDEYDPEIKALLKATDNLNDKSALEKRLKDIFLEYFEGVEVNLELIESLAQKINILSL